MPDKSRSARLPDAALDALSDPVFVFDTGGRASYHNEAARDATGRDATTLEEAAFTDVFAGLTEDRLRTVAAEDGDGTSVDAMLLTVDGGRVAVELDAARLDGADGALVVTARRLSVDEQAGTDGTDILDRMTDAFFAVDEDWRLTYVNEHARGILSDAMDGDADVDAGGVSLWEAIPEAVDTEFYEAYHEAMRTQEPVSFEAYYEPLDAYLAVRAYPSPSGLSVYFRDVSERHRREAALAEQERVLREMHDITADAERSFEEQVDALLDLGNEVLGTSTGALSRIRGDDYEFRSVRGQTDVEPGDVFPLGATNCERTAAAAQTLVLEDVAHDAPELAERTGYTEWGISCYLGAPVFVDDEVWGTFCFYDGTPHSEPFTEWEITLVDLMSQWAGYELARRRVLERLESQNEKLDQFASIVSHDLRNPLNLLDGHLELAEETGDCDHFEQCRKTVSRMEALIDDLLTLARAGVGVAEVAETSLDTVAREAWASIGATDASLDVDADATVLADEDRLRQLLVNLFRNAVEHGGADVAVAVRQVDDGFYVADDGPGIQEADHDDVFDPGYSTTAEGTGFGLNIVAEIVDAHDWTVTVGSSDAGGARFDVGRVERA